MSTATRSSKKQRDPFLPQEKRPPRKTAVQLIYDVVSQIPRGRVATYGQIAELAGMPGRSRQVGYALSALPSDTGVPWHRVINAQGMISARSNPAVEALQKKILQKEGIRFDKASRISLDRFRW